jgi:hypothetical protein
MESAGWARFADFLSHRNFVEGSAGLTDTRLWRKENKEIK